MGDEEELLSAFSPLILRQMTGSWWGGGVEGQNQ
jgi:hypothetical protein